MLVKIGDISEDAADLILKLLAKDSDKRLGSSGSEEIKLHKFFANVVWNDVFKKKIKAPWLPKLSSNYDISYCDKASQL